MKMKKNLIALGAALILGLTGCGGQTQVNVEQAGMLTTAAVSSDKFAGVVVSENVVEITRDTDKQIQELYVAAGDTVRVNEKLFEYDSDTLSLTIDKQELEMDKLEQQIKEQTAQKKAIEKEINTLTGKIKKEKNKTEKANLESQLATQQMRLQSASIELTEATYKKDTLKAEIDYNKNMLKNAVVRSPIKGTVRSINENGTPYITIQQAGAYQVKGMLNELSLGAGIMEGVGVTILSRTDSLDYWTGVVSLVDYNTTSSNEYDNMYGDMGDGMSTSTNYPFYITLDDTDGLLLGQHVYIQISAAALSDDLLRIPEGYIMDVTMDEETWLTTGTVWGVNMDTLSLTKMTVTLGEYDPTYGTYVILEGITAEDYLADPADKGVREGAAVSLRSELEYMGLTEPTESTAPTGAAGEAADPAVPSTAPAIDISPEEPQEPQESQSTQNPMSSGSLVLTTEDPEKVD